MSVFDKAPCRSADPSIFFPKSTDSFASIAAAKAVCDDCPMSAFVACAAHAVEHAEPSGVWAGVNISQAAGPNRAAARRRLEDISGLTWPKKRHPAGFAAKVMAIQRMTRSGHTALEISRRVGVQPRTVERHRAAS